MNILLTGASGFIGSHLLRKLHAAGHQVIGCVRDPQAASANFSETRYITGDFSRDLSESDWIPRLTDIDVVINAVGIICESRGQNFNALHRDAPIALFRAAAKCDVTKVIQISALGADADAQSQYHLSKRAADEALAKLDLNWVILHPSIVYGAGARSMALFRAMASLPITPLVGDGSQPVQPVHIDDLSRVVVQAVEDDQLNQRHLNLVGPEPISIRLLLEKQRHWLGDGALRTLAVPYPVSLKMAQIGSSLGATPFDAEAVTMLQRGNIGEVAPLQQACGFTPRSLDEVLQNTPATEADRWHARLYFLAPMLRITLALLWILTAVVSALLYPVEQSYALLQQVGITEQFAPHFLYGAAALDLLVGVALLGRYHVTAVALLQIALITGYTIIISMALPEYWLHPYGPVSKNLPLIVATLIMLQLERR